MWLRSWASANFGGYPLFQELNLLLGNWRALIKVTNLLIILLLIWLLLILDILRLILSLSYISLIITLFAIDLVFITVIDIRYFNAGVVYDIT